MSLGDRTCDRAPAAIKAATATTADKCQRFQRLLCPCRMGCPASRGSTRSVEVSIPAGTAGREMLISTRQGVGGQFPLAQDELRDGARGMLLEKESVRLLSGRSLVFPGLGPTLPASGGPSDPMDGEERLDDRPCSSVKSEG